MIQIICDNCGNELKNEENSELGTEPDVHCTLELKVQRADKTIRPIQMDLCRKCTKKYIAVLKEPI